MGGQTNEVGYSDLVWRGHLRSGGRSGSFRRAASEIAQ